MSNGPGLIARIALRETRGGLRGFGVFLACLALGAMAMSLVGSLAAGLEAGLKADARRMLGGDMELRQLYRPLPDEALDYLNRRGAKVTRLARVRVMAHPPVGKASLADLKAVDRLYPLVGELTLKGGGSARAVLEAGQALASPDLANRIKVSVGDEIGFGLTKVRLGGLIQVEPDRAGSFFALAPRLMVNWSVLEKSGLLLPGSMVYYFYKVSLPPEISPQQMQSELEGRFKTSGWRIRLLGSRGRGLGRAMQNMNLYLTLVSLGALLVGGIGVASAVENHLEGKKSSIAAMKCLGASGAQVFGIYLGQTMIFALLGTVLGMLLGLAAAYGAADYLAAELGVRVEMGLYPLPLAAAGAGGLSTALAFSLAPLSAAARVRPARLFRGFAQATPPRPSWQARLGSAAAFACLLCVMLLTTHNRSLAWGFAGLMLGSALVLWACGYGIKRLAARLPRPRNPRLAAALGNLHRPGAATSSVIFSLGLGLTVLVAVYLSDANILDRIERGLPDKAPSYVFFEVPKQDMPGLRSLLAKQPGTGHLEARPMLRGRISAINGVPSAKAKINPEVSWALRGERAMSFSATAPPEDAIVKGKWWQPDYKGPPLISLEDRLGRGFGVGPGDTLGLNIMGREITATIANLRHVDWRNMRLNYSVIFSPGVLDGAPYVYTATLHAQDEAEAGIFDAVSREYPDLALIYVKDVMAELIAMFKRISLVIRSMAGLTLAVGLLVLAQALRTGLTRRYYEAVVFKVFGATKADPLLSLGAEFGLLGAVAALMAVLLGAVASFAFIDQFIHSPWRFIPAPVVLISLGGLAVTIVLGLLGVRRILNSKAAKVLRNP